MGVGDRVLRNDLQEGRQDTKVTAIKVVSVYLRKLLPIVK